MEKDDYDLWLNPGMTNPEKLTDLIKPFDSRKMSVYPVSSTVSNVKNDRPECGKDVTLRACGMLRSGDCCHGRARSSSKSLFSIRWEITVRASDRPALMCSTRICQ